MKRMLTSTTASPARLSNRREFIKAGAGLLAVSGCRGVFCELERAGFSLAMAGITLVKFKTDAALDFCERHGFRALCVKDFHLPFEATASEIAEFRRKCADRGITPYAAGPIYITSADEAKRRFDYAAALGACGYSGRLGLELANAFPDNPQWIDESRDYFNGLI